ncbi:putative enoyl-CoA hydratase [Hyaloraphidium curvatum]|nr:putative enoyl-CoA hydratase [Hyaloraphidium curvatum]
MDRYASFSLLRVSLSSSGIATVRITNPPINLMTPAMLREYTTLVPMLAADPAVRVVVFRSGVEGFFTAHFDLETLAKVRLGKAGALNPAHWRLQAFHEVAETLRTMPKPTIAVVNGRCGGGGSEMALSMDMRFAGPDAVFNQVEVGLGMVPGGSATVRLPRLCGRSRAMEIVLGADDFNAQEAERYGWVNRSFRTAEELEAHVSRLAERIARFEPNAVARAKRSVLRAERGVAEDLLAEAADNAETFRTEGGRMTRMVEMGAQTVEGGARLAELVAKL